MLSTTYTIFCLTSKHTNTLRSSPRSMSTRALTLLLLLICLSMHACTSRPLSSKAADGKEREGHQAGGAIEGLKVVRILTRKADQEMEKKAHASVSFRVPRKKQGSEVLISYDVGLRHADIIEGMERRALSVVGISDDHVTEETINSKQSAMAPDVVAMDYEPPHRKTPIHN